MLSIEYIFMAHTSIHVHTDNFNQLYLINPEVAGSNLALVNFSLFIQNLSNFIYNLNITVFQHVIFVYTTHNTIQYNTNQIELSE